MAVETTYTALRENLASVLDRVVADREVVVVKRRGSEDVAIVSASELAGLEETAYLLRSPKNARRLLAARKSFKTAKVMTPEQLRGSVGLGKKA